VTDSLLLVGDIHLGRTPTRLADSGVNAAALGPAEAWRRTVDFALERGVGAVVLAGDVVEHERDRFEAWGLLRDGVERLVAGGVQVLGVAGNHDAIALPKLADRLGGFRLVGGGGTWECVQVGGFDVVGWSFPDRHYTENPTTLPSLRAALDARRTGVPAIGVLHADLDAGASRYAPVRRTELAELGLAGVFLGHIHAPSPLGDERIGYLGSLVGLDRGESGARGPWLLRHADEGGLSLEQIPLGPVHWTVVEVALDDIPDDEDAIHVAIERAIRASAAEAPRFVAPLLAVGVSLELTGRSRARRAAGSLLHGGRTLEFAVDGARWVVVDVRDRTRPAIELEALAGSESPPGALAELLLRIEREGASAIPEAVVRSLEAVDTPELARRGIEPLTPRAGELVTEALLEMLDVLLEQQRNGEGRE
jgi:hypothetical protein